MLERRNELIKRFREVKFTTKLEKAANAQLEKFHNIRYQEGDLVFYQEKMGKAWKGPVKVWSHNNQEVWIWANGGMKKVADCKVKIYKINETLEELDEMKNNDKDFTLDKTDDEESNAEDIDNKDGIEEKNMKK